MLKQKILTEKSNMHFLMDDFVKSAGNYTIAAIEYVRTFLHHDDYINYIQKVTYMKQPNIDIRNNLIAVINKMKDITEKIENYSKQEDVEISQFQEQYNEKANEEGEQWKPDQEEIDRQQNNISKNLLLKAVYQIMELITANEEIKYFPGGWRGSGVGEFADSHAIGIAVKYHTNDKTFDVTIINTGDGIEYVPRIFSESTKRNMCLAFLTFEKIPQVLFKEFVSGCLLSNSKGSKEFFYEACVYLIVDYQSNAPETPEYYYPEQISGSCSFRGVYLCLYHYLIIEKKYLTVEQFTIAEYIEKSIKIHDLIQVADVNNIEDRNILEVLYYVNDGGIQKLKTIGSDFKNLVDSSSKRYQDNKKYIESIFDQYNLHLQTNPAYQIGNIVNEKPIEKYDGRYNEIKYFYTNTGSFADVLDQVVKNKVKTSSNKGELFKKLFDFNQETIGKKQTFEPMIEFKNLLDLMNLIIAEPEIKASEYLYIIGLIDDRFIALHKLLIANKNNANIIDTVKSQEVTIIVQINVCLTRYHTIAARAKLELVHLNTSNLMKFIFVLISREIMYIADTIKQKHIKKNVEFGIDISNFQVINGKYFTKTEYILDAIRKDNTYLLSSLENIDQDLITSEITPLLESIQNMMGKEIKEKISDFYIKKQETQSKGGDEQMNDAIKTFVGKSNNDTILALFVLLNFDFYELQHEISPQSIYTMITINLDAFYSFREKFKCFHSFYHTIMLATMPIVYFPGKKNTVLPDYFKSLYYPFFKKENIIGLYFLYSYSNQDIAFYTSLIKLYENNCYGNLLLYFSSWLTIDNNILNIELFNKSIGLHNLLLHFGKYGPLNKTDITIIKNINEQDDTQRTFFNLIDLQNIILNLLTVYNNNIETVIETHHIYICMTIYYLISLYKVKIAGENNEINRMLDIITNKLLSLKIINASLFSWLASFIMNEKIENGQYIIDNLMKIKNRYDDMYNSPNTLENPNSFAIKNNIYKLQCNTVGQNIECKTLGNLIFPFNHDTNRDQKSLKDITIDYITLDVFISEFLDHSDYINKLFTIDRTEISPTLKSLLKPIAQIYNINDYQATENTYETNDLIIYKTNFLEFAHEEFLRQNAENQFPYSTCDLSNFDPKMLSIENKNIEINKNKINTKFQNLDLTVECTYCSIVFPAINLIYHNIDYSVYYCSGRKIWNGFSTSGEILHIEKRVGNWLYAGNLQNYLFGILLPGYSKTTGYIG